LAKVDHAGVCHANCRDLKLENVLLQKPEVDAAAPATRKLPIAKISDFGLHVVSRVALHSAQLL
jgi:serine/threonine protein kinase